MVVGRIAHLQTPLSGFSIVPTGFLKMTKRTGLWCVFYCSVACVNIAFVHGDNVAKREMVNSRNRFMAKAHQSRENEAFGNAANFSRLKPTSTNQVANHTTNKNLIDWVLGAIGLTPPNNPPPLDASHPPKCPECACGVALQHKRIVGGVETLVNEYPWMVALQYNSRFYCGASLINSQYLLTAAHCVQGFKADRLSAVFFDHDRSTSQETVTFTRRVRAIFKHNAYGNAGNYNNDIALLKLDQEVALDAMTRPVCLPPTGKSFTGLNGVAVGWGATAEHGQVSLKLREVTVPIMSNRDCKKTGYNSRITENMLCAGFPDGKKDSCQGDSGGPLHVINGSFHAIVGIVSWGEGCAQPNYPGVYSRVNRYITWILSNTKDACYCKN